MVFLCLPYNKNPLAIDTFMLLVLVTTLFSSGLVLQVELPYASDDLFMFACLLCHICLILSYLVSLCHICLILSRFVTLCLSCLVLSCLVLSWLVLSCPILSLFITLVLSCLVLSCLFLSCLHHHCHSFDRIDYTHHKPSFPNT